ncbi:hypothetical protein VCHC69A1_3232B, partial [Vibrio cholerae HC-69A1]
CYALPAP